MCSMGRLQDFNTFITVLKTSFVCRVKLTERNPENQMGGLRFLNRPWEYYEQYYQKLYLRWGGLAAHHCCPLCPSHKRWASLAEQSLTQASAGFPNTHLVSLMNFHSLPAKHSIKCSTHSVVKLPLPQIPCRTMIKGAFRTTLARQQNTTTVCVDEGLLLHTQRHTTQLTVWTQTYNTSWKPDLGMQTHVWWKKRELPEVGGKKIYIKYSYS